MGTEEFVNLLHQKSEELYRDMPWREDTRPYYILVSELMLQQTQVARVIPKFEAFIERFPDVSSLAKATLADVLRLWQGLGYNRRAKFLHEAAKMITNDFNGDFPATYAEIMTLPGVGKNTAGAIMAYAFNQPAVFIETNIRTVYIHHFFNNHVDVDDKEIIALVTKTLDHDNPRAFYWALMDYGAWLKASGVRNISTSKHYKKQSALKGSVREVRGQIIRELAINDIRLEDLQHQIKADARFESALVGLLTDGLVTQTDDLLHLTK